MSQPEDVGSLLINNPVQSFLEYPDSVDKPTGFLDKLPSITQINGPVDETIKPSDKPFSFQHPSTTYEQFVAFGSESETDYDDVDSKPRISSYSRPTNDWKEGLSTQQEIRAKAQEMIDNLCVIDRKVVWCNYGFYEGKNLSSLFQNDIEDFVRYMSPTEEEHRLRMYVVARIAKAVRHVWPEAQVKVFGSFDTKLYLPSSDLDIVVFCEQYGGSTAHRKLSAALRSSGLANNGKLEIIPARIPIIKFTDSIGQFPIDISFNIETGVHASARLRENMIQFPALRPLAIILKQFLLMRGLNEVFSGGLGSFGLASLIISFLQLHPVLQGGQVDQFENLSVLLIEFLDLYGRRLSYDDVGIALHNNGLYFDKAQSALNNFKPNSLTIQDPEEFSNDITRGTFNMRLITKSFARGYDILTGAFYELDEIYVRENNLLSPEHWSTYKIRSILATMVDIQDSVLAHREFVAQKYEDIKELVSDMLDVQSESQLEQEGRPSLKRPCSPDVEFFMEDSDEQEASSVGDQTFTNNSLSSEVQGQLSYDVDLTKRIKQSLQQLQPTVKKSLQTFKRSILGYIIFRNIKLTELYQNELEVRSQDLDTNTSLRKIWFNFDGKKDILRLVEVYIKLYTQHVYIEMLPRKYGGRLDDNVVLDNAFVSKQKYDLVAFIVYTTQNKYSVTVDTALSYSAFKTRIDGDKYYHIAKREVSLGEVKYSSNSAKNVTQKEKKIKQSKQKVQKKNDKATQQILQKSSTGK